MNKLITFLSTLFLMFSYSCSDSDNEPSIPNGANNLEAEKQINEVLDKISQEEELISFKEELARLDATKFAEKEFTILAYKNPRLINKNAKATKEEETLRHIIGGKYTFDDLKKSKYLIALSKDSLNISYSETNNSISINGVLLGKSMIADKSIIFVADSIIPLVKETIEINKKEYKFKVMMINENWSSTNNQEDAGVAENAKITIYKDDIVIKELRTDKDGLASFSYQEDINLNYIVNTDTASMLFNRFLVRGLFTSQEQLDLYPAHNDYKSTLGGLILADLNGDGIINTEDQTDVDYLNNLSDDQIIYLVSESYTFPKHDKEPEEIVDIDMAYDAFDDAEEYFSMFENKYSTLASRQSISSSSVDLDSLWHKSYDAIRKLSIVINSGKENFHDMLEMDVFRARLHFNLSNTFRNITLQLDNNYENLPRSQIKEIQDYALLVSDRYLDNLSDSIKYTSREYTNRILIHKLQENHLKVKQLSEEAINSGKVYLHSNFYYSDIDIVRLYLLAAESNMQLGNLAQAILLMNNLYDVEGTAPLPPSTSKSILQTKIQEFYTKKTNDLDSIDDGIKFINLSSWNQTSTWGRFMIFPIPLSALNKFENKTLLIQNAGW